MPSYTLYYFAARARAEIIRLIFAYADVAYNEKTISQEDWKGLKDKTLFGQMPFLELDGKQLAQSYSIARYLANQFKLTGKDAWEAALCDMYVDGFSDCMDKMKPVIMAILANDEAKKNEEFARFKAESLLPCLELYEGFLEKNGGKFLVGSQLTWADLLLASALDTMVKFDQDVLSKFPKLAALKTMVFNLPNIKKYVDARPQYSF